MNRTAIFTSCAANYLPKARVLGESIRRWHGDADVFLLLTDDLPAGSQPHVEPFTAVVTAEELAIPSWEPWIFGHTVVEACTAVKPFMLRRLLERGYERVLYFDPDIVIFAPLTGMLDEFDQASILLTPHQCKADTEWEAIQDNEICSLKYGLFNLGFVGVKNDAEGRRYADWWADRCYRACFDEIATGIFTDQKWNDFVPIFFPRTKILTAPVYNVATWNYSQRLVEGAPEHGFTVDGMPLVFHHFTGYDSGAHHVMLAKYGSRMPATKRLSDWYASRLRAAQGDLVAVRWKYGSYADGAAIAPAHRKIYRSRADVQRRFPRPFQAAPDGTPDDTYAAWLKSVALWDTCTPHNGRTMHQFLLDTEDELRGHVACSRKLRPWMKRIVTPVLGAAFAVLRYLAG